MSITQALICGQTVLAMMYCAISHLHISWYVHVITSAETEGSNHFNIYTRLSREYDLQPFLWGGSPLVCSNAAVWLVMMITQVLGFVWRANDFFVSSVFPVSIQFIVPNSTLPYPACICTCSYNYITMKWAALQSQLIAIGIDWLMMLS